MSFAVNIDTIIRLGGSPGFGIEHSTDPVPTSLEFSTQPGGAVAGSPFTQQPVVTVKDQFGATLTYYTGQVGVFLLVGSELDSATIVPTLLDGVYELFSVTCVAGVGTFPDLKITLAGTYQLASHCDAIAAAPETFLSDPFDVASADPLAGITFALRLQTHNGDNVPLGLYQDTACTIPATLDGDLIKGWKGVLMGVPVTYTQSDDQKALLLLYENGVPTAWGDGVDDTMVGPLATASLVFSMYCALRSDDHTVNSRVLCNGNSGGYYFAFSDTNRNLLWENVQNNYCGTATDQFEVWSAVRPSNPASFWVDGSLIRSNIGSAPSVPSGSTTIFDAIGNPAPFGGTAVAFLIADADHDSSTRQLIETYLATMLP